jgi:hypothetical protein
MSAINTAFTGFDQSMLTFLVPLQPCHVLYNQKKKVYSPVHGCAESALHSK